MKLLKIMTLLLALAAYSSAAVCAAPAEPVQPKVAAYLAAWETWSAKDIDAKKLTHINLAFARIQDGVIANVKVDGKSIEPSHFAELKKAKQANPALCVSIAVGGWGGDGFSDAALTAESREKFAASVAAYLKDNDLDGIDIDWEYPVQGGWGAIKARPEDKENFTLFLQAIRSKLDALGQQENKHYLLTYAASVQPWAISNLEFEKVVPLVDAIYLMTYDYHGAWEPQTGHLAPLYPNPKDNIGIGGTAAAVSRYLAAGAPPEKLIFGVPFYGRFWQNAANKEHGLYQKAANQGGGQLKYSEISAGYTAKQGFVRYWDPASQAAYLYNEKSGQFISFNDPEALRQELQYIRTLKLGGVFMWEYTQDSSGQLLQTMYDGMRK